MPGTSQSRRGHFCIACGYDLRGTSPDGHCPECGLAVRIGRGEFGIDGDRLVVTHGTVLPPLCIKTGQPIYTRPVTRRLYYVHPAVHLFFFVHPLLLWLPAYLVCRIPCRVTYHLSRTAKRRQRTIRAVLAGSLTLVLASIIIVMIRFDDPRAAAAISVFLLLILIGEWFVLRRLNDPLRAVKHKDGRFWLAGVGDAFLDAVEEEHKNSEVHGTTHIVTESSAPA